MDFDISAESATERLAACLAHACTAPGLIWLQGGLGSGKTALVRAWLTALGHSGPVPSPTYTLCEIYPLERQRVLHLDLYRLGGSEELIWLGIHDEIDIDTLLLIEWPEHGARALPAPDLVLTLHFDGTRRTCRLAAVGGRGSQWLQSMGDCIKNDNLWS